MTWLIGIVGERFAKPVLFGGIIILAGLALFILGRCTGGDNSDVAAQAEQTNRSGDAIIGAAQEAVATIGDNTASEAAIDQAVGEATKGIEDAQSVDVIRDLVVGSLCAQRAHSNDPACRVREAGSD